MSFGSLPLLRTLVAVLFLVAVLMLAFEANAQGGPVLRPGQPAPTWTLPAPEGGKVAFPADAGGKPAVLLFWATWCPYCRALMPHLQAIREDYRDQGVEVFAVNIWEDDDPEAYLRDAGYDFRLALEGDPVALRYGVDGTPGLFVVDGRGRIVMNRFLVALPAPLATMPKGERPARSAEAWADLVRRAIEAAPAR
jgi:thiol-disulfide isomerase/thioredoxin